MNGTHVVALESILNCYLPVGFDQQPVAIDQVSQRSTYVFEGACKFTEPASKVRAAAAALANENEFTTAFHIPGFEGEVPAVGFRQFVKTPEIGDSDRNSETIVNPAMILALQKSVPFPEGANGAASVRANIEEALKVTLEVLNDNGSRRSA
jgi:hypothetical protein